MHAAVCNTAHLSSWASTSIVSCFSSTTSCITPAALPYAGQPIVVLVLAPKPLYPGKANRLWAYLIPVFRATVEPMPSLRMLVQMRLVCWTCQTTGAC